MIAAFGTPTLTGFLHTESRLSISATYSWADLCMNWEANGEIDASLAEMEKK